MITVTLNRTEFEYDIHSLIKAFFPKEDVELYYTKEAHADEKNVACTNHSAEQEEAGSSHFSIDYADDRISIAWDDAPDGPARRTFAVDFSNRTETKNALKEHLYRLLEEETGQPLPWGTLTGIRPTKIPMQMLDEGKTKEEIASYMKQTYLASDEKINLSIAIAERERALLSRLDYKNGYSLYIGIPFCPSTCLYCSFTSYPLTAWKTQVDAYLDALEKELDYVAAKNYHRKLNSIYIGGGTPTTLEPYQLDRLIRKIRCSFDLGDCLHYFVVSCHRADPRQRDQADRVDDRVLVRWCLRERAIANAHKNSDDDGDDPGEDVLAVISLYRDHFLHSLCRQSRQRRSQRQEC